MYDELVKRLRFLEEMLRTAQFSEAKGMIEEAADAIEELSRENKSLAKSVNEASEILRRRWIPVTERLPETSGVYLAWMQWDLTDPDDNPSAYPIEYDDEEEAFGWWRSYCDPESLGWSGEDFIRYEGVTHWMPLPEPPKEE